MSIHTDNAISESVLDLVERKNQCITVQETRTYFYNPVDPHNMVSPYLLPYTNNGRGEFFAISNTSNASQHSYMETERCVSYGVKLGGFLLSDDMEQERFTDSYCWHGDWCRMNTEMKLLAGLPMNNVLGSEPYVIVTSNPCCFDKVVNYKPYLTDYDADGNSLLWGRPETLHYTIQGDTRTSFAFDYYKNYIAEVYNIENKKLKFTCSISPAFYKSLRFNPFFRMSNQLYFCTEIDSWSDIDGQCNITARRIEDYRKLINKEIASEFVVTLISDPSMGSTTGQGTYSSTVKSVRIEAIPKEDYMFEQWSDGSIANPRTLMTSGEDITLTAIFKAKPVIPNRTLTVNWDANHVLSVNGVEGNGIATTYPQGYLVLLQANMREGCRFKKWSDGNVENPRSLHLMSDTTLNVESEEAMAIMTVNCEVPIRISFTDTYGVFSAGPMVDIDGTTVTCHGFTNVNVKTGAISSSTFAGQVTIKMPVNKVFSIWSDQDSYPVFRKVIDEWDGYSTDDRLCTITMSINNDTTINGVYSNANLIRINEVVQTSDYAMNSICKYEINHVSLPANGALLVRYGDQSYFRCIPGEGINWLSWEIDGQAFYNNPMSARFSTDKTITSNIRAEEETVICSVVIEPLGAGSVSGAGVHKKGEAFKLEAFPNTGHSFIEWTWDEGTAMSPDNPLEMKLDESKTITAHFD